MKRPSEVPETDDIVTVVWLLPAFDGAACRHTTVVPLAHDVVLQSDSASIAVGVMSAVAKLRPLIVADAPPVPGALLLPTRFTDTAGAFEKTRSNTNINKIMGTQIFRTIEREKR